jgi:hypothetical protein
MAALATPRAPQFLTELAIVHFGPAMGEESIPGTVSGIE